MSRGRWYHNCDWASCRRKNFRFWKRAEKYSLPKPKEAEDVNGNNHIEMEKESDILIIRNIDPCIAINGALHHTSKYDLMSREFEPALVIRRGQSFRIDIDLNRPYREETDGISFILTADDEEKPSYGQGTLIAIPLLHTSNQSLPWNAILENSHNNTLTIQIIPSPDCVVSKWRLDVDTKLLTSEGAYSYSWYTPIYILYNPWCKEDPVYMQSEEWRDECILEDVGLIWRGTSNRLRPCIWNYGQFEKSVLDCALYLIKYVGKVHGQARADPVFTTRGIAAAVNSVDDEGAVVGSWTESFEDGTPPTKWLGSMEIMQEYYKKKKPVKYGQCWVFSGVVTTICRAVGIPARTVTNYSSAHDTQSSLTVDYFVDEKGKVMEELNSDSVWNFHVWNEVWMDRLDLGEYYSGWQAVDATPQEKSDNLYRCGPASLAAVKEGEVKKAYDCSFLFAEVNADKIFWRYYGPTQPLKLLKKDTFGIGKMISTKAAGKFDREDITHLYKHEEESKEERTTMLKALKQSQNIFSRYYLNDEFNDIFFDFELNDDIKIGEPFKVLLVIQNRSYVKDYHVKVKLRVDVITYKGKVGKAVKEENYKQIIKKQSMEELELKISYKEYYKRLLDQAAFNISCLASVEGTDYEYFAEDDFRVRKPDVKIILNNTPIEMEECKATVYIVNPLPVTLRKCEFKIEAPGLSKKFRLDKYISPGEKGFINFKFRPKKFGKQTIAAKFTSKELNDCDGYLNFWVDFKNDEKENEV